MRKYTRSQTVGDRFEAKYKENENGCWMWFGSTCGHDRPVMMMTLEPGVYRKKYASHVAWFLNTGVWPTSRSVLRHTCDVSLCVNPEHLVLGTQKQNMEERTVRSTTWTSKPKLTERDVRYIRSSTESQIALAHKFGVTQTSICNVINRKTYKWVG